MRQTILYPVITPLGSDGDFQVRLNSVAETTVRITLSGIPGVDCLVRSVRIDCVPFPAIVMAFNDTLYSE